MNESIYMRDVLLAARNASAGTIAAVVGSLALVYIVSSYVVSYRRLSHIPGPPLAAWTNLWWVNAAISRKGHLYLYDACKKYGMTDSGTLAQDSQLTYHQDRLFESHRMSS